MTEPMTLYCGFCGKSQHEVATVVVGAIPGANICDECVDLARQIIVMGRTGHPPTGPRVMVAADIGILETWSFA